MSRCAARLPAWRLEKLIADGRIHPTRIEEMVEKAKREVDAVIKAEGERATFETGVRGLHPELVKMLGRLHYRTSYGQNVLQPLHRGVPAGRHDGRRTGRRRDGCPAGQACCTIWASPSTTRWKAPMWRWAWSSPGSTSEKEDIIHAIQAHHGDVEPRTLVACLVQAADAISAARPGARRENLENYIKRLEQLEEHRRQLPRRGEVLCHPGRPRSPRDGQARAGFRGPDGHLWPAILPRRSKRKWNTPARSR